MQKTYLVYVGPDSFGNCMFEVIIVAYISESEIIEVGFIKPIKPYNSY